MTQQEFEKRTGFVMPASLYREVEEEYYNSEYSNVNTKRTKVRGINMKALRQTTDVRAIAERLFNKEIEAVSTERFDFDVDELIEGNMLIVWGKGYINSRNLSNLDYLNGTGYHYDDTVVIENAGYRLCDQDDNIITEGVFHVA